MGDSRLILLQQRLYEEDLEACRLHGRGWSILEHKAFVRLSRQGHEIARVCVFLVQVRPGDSPLAGHTDAAEHGSLIQGK